MCGSRFWCFRIFYISNLSFRLLLIYLNSNLNLWHYKKCYPNSINQNPTKRTISCSSHSKFSFKCPDSGFQTPAVQERHLGDLLSKLAYQSILFLLSGAQSLSIFYNGTRSQQRWSNVTLPLQMHLCVFVGIYRRKAAFAIAH